MKVIKGQPGSGKTNQLIELALQDTNALFVVKDEKTRDKVLQKINYSTQIKVITHEDFMVRILQASMNGFWDTDIVENVYIDDAELMNKRFTETVLYNIAAITITEE